MKKIAVLIYSDFSMQEIANLMYLMRWNYDMKTTMIATTMDIVVSEEGIQVQPELTVDDFVKEDYACLILSGCSNFLEPLGDEKIFQFLHQFKGDNDFVIGAICAGPIFLAQAGLLEGKKFTNSLYVEMNEQFKFIEAENVVYKPLVVDDNIITAVGRATRIFAVEIARRLDFEISDDAMCEDFSHYEESDYKHHLDEASNHEFMTIFKDYLR